MEVVNDELRGRLIDAAGQILSEHGPAALSLRKVAAAAGTSTMAVYTHFGDKQALLAAMHREGFDRLGEHLAKAAAEAADPLSGLAAFGRAYRVAALENRHLYQLMFGSAAPGFVPADEDDQAAVATYTPLVEGVRYVVEQGWLVGDPERIALHLWVVAHGMVSLELTGFLPAADPAAAYEEAMAYAAAPFLSPEMTAPLVA